jgi:hypothetical protein
MTFYRDFPPTKWFVAALLVATAQVAIAPNTAQAGCGDYVILGGHEAQPDRAHPVLTHQQRNPADPLHRGCSGPNCSNDSPRPLDEPTVPIETDVRHLGLTAVQWLGAADVARFARFADDASFPRIVTSCVYRPPR